MKKSTAITIFVFAIIIIVLIYNARMTNKANTTDGIDMADSVPNSTASTTPAIGTTTAMRLQGRWIGPEGTSLSVEYIGATDPHKYRLSFVMLDGPIATVGDETADGTGITFVRNFETLTLRHGSGLETGMKYLADKSDCIVVKQSEGYCRGEE